MLGPQDFAKLPQLHVSATGHEGKKHEYDGVSLRGADANQRIPYESSVSAR